MSNTQPQKFENVKVYLGDPWYVAAGNSKLRNVNVWSSTEDVKYEELKCDGETGKFNQLIISVKKYPRTRKFHF